MYNQEKISVDASKFIIIFVAGLFFSYMAASLIDLQKMIFGSELKVVIIYIIELLFVLICTCCFSRRRLFQENKDKVSFQSIHCNIITNKNYIKFSFRAKE